MAEPEAKKSKMSESDSFTKEGTHCDRTLVINDAVYRVNSETLIEHSEYFRVMFTSEFLEKDRDEIELKEVDEEEFRMFLSVLFEPAKQEVTQNNLPLMCKVFVFFQATQYLVDFLKAKEVFELIPAHDLLQLSLEQVIPVLKDAVENWLIEKFKKLQAIGDETKMGIGYFSYYSFDFAPFIIECLDLVSEFKLKDLKKNIEARLLTEYKQSKHNSSAEDEYVELLSKYGLEDLKVLVEEYAMGLERKGPQTAGGILASYYQAAKPLVMNKLKDSVEEHLLNLVQEIENGETTWETIKKYYSGDPNDKRAEYLKSCAVPWLTKFLETSHCNDLHKLRAFIEEWVLEGESAFVNEHSIQDYLEFSQYSNRIKEAVEQFLIKQYRESTNLSNEDYSSYVDDCDRYELKKLEDVIENDLIEEFKAGENPQKFDDHRVIFRLPKLKETIESPLIEQLNTDGEKDSEFLQKCFDYSTKYLMDNLMKAFDEYLLNEFEDTRSLKNIKFAFAEWDYFFKSKFKSTVIDFLKTVDYDDDDLKAGRKYILELPLEQKNLVLEAILRKPDEEEE